MNRLVLFDIDGTILSTRGKAIGAFRRAMIETYGTEGDPSNYSFGGRTDPQIAYDLLGRAGFSRERIDEGLDALWGRYLGYMEVAFERPELRPEVFVGVRELVARIHEHPSAILGLLTGNLERGAAVKLRAAGFETDPFVVGAYGSDSHLRGELPAIAVARAEELTGRRFEGKEIVILGDTPLDVDCARGVGGRVIGVATGEFDVADLHNAGADVVFEDFSDLEAVEAAIFLDLPSLTP